MKPRWWIVSVLRDTRLNADARCLLCFLGTQPAGWRYNVEECRRYTHFGRNKHFEVMGEIERAGYIAREHVRNKRGRIIHTRLNIADSPSPTSRKSGRGAAPTGVPVYRTLPESPKPGQASSYDRDTDGKEPAEPFRVIEGGRRAETLGFAENRMAAK